MTERAKASHAPIWGFTAKDGQLLVGDQPITRLAAQVGSTPFFAYDRRLLSARVQEVRDILPERMDLHYAVKANPMPAVVNHMARQVDGLDVASAGEMQVALDAGMAPELISFAGPGKTDEEIHRAVAAGIVVVAESLHDARRAVASGEALGVMPRLAVRINPSFELKGSGMRMGGGPKPFGIDAEQAPDALKEISAMKADVHGLHIYGGSQSLDVAALESAQRQTMELATDLLAYLEQTPRWINIGGGIGIPYFPGDPRVDLPALGDALARVVDDYEHALGDILLAMELGRFLVGEAGVYIARVVDKKVSRGRTYLVTDGGLHHHLSASGNFGQVLRKNYPVAIANRMGHAATEEVVDIVGCLCTPLDRLGDKVDLPQAEIGDLVVVFQSGAYGLSASPINFLGHPAPCEVLV